jgi:hypothetical protein
MQIMSGYLAPSGSVSRNLPLRASASAVSWCTCDSQFDLIERSSIATVVFTILYSYSRTKFGYLQGEQRGSRLSLFLRTDSR